MISQNHNGLGNPNHDNKTGQFTSNGAGSGGSDKKVNIKSEQGKSMKIGKDLSQKEFSFLKKSGMVDKYAKQAGLDRPKQETETVDDFIKWSKSNGYDFSGLMEGLKEFDKTKMARILKFILSGFDFNKLKGKKQKYKLNEKVFKKPNNFKETSNNFKKVSDEEVRQLNMDKVALNKEIQNNNETKKALESLRKQYDRVSNVATEEQQRRIELLFSKILNRTREKDMEIKEKNLENKKRANDIQDRFVKTNKMFKKGAID